MAGVDLFQELVRGAGSYAQSHLLPNLKGLTDVVLQGVMTSTPASARSIAERFGFAFCTSAEEEISGRGTGKGWIADQVGNDKKVINTIFIATRHDSHTRYVVSFR